MPTHEVAGKFGTRKANILFVPREVPVNYEFGLIRPPQFLPYSF